MTLKRKIYSLSQHGMPKKGIDELPNTTYTVGSLKLYTTLEKYTIVAVNVRMILTDLTIFLYVPVQSERKFARVFNSDPIDSVYRG